MYLAIPTQPTCVSAWVAAASAIADDIEAYNVMIDVDNPTKFESRDNAAIALVDSFLRDRDANPIATVVNTLFPLSLYQKYGSPKFYEVYHSQVFDKLTTSKLWGRYFERLTRRLDKDAQMYNPLQEMIEKLQTQKKSPRKFKSVFELAIYDPSQDRGSLRGGQCLSFLSFKMHPTRGLTLTAMYRNQTYTTRCLGNLIALGLLQEFVAKEAGLNVGPLTCISTHAELDTGPGWNISDARQLIKQAAKLLQNEQAPV